DWVMALPHAHLLPHVLTPGDVIGQIQPDIAAHFGINSQCTVHAGTTDSSAAFIATGVNESGVGVTTLGTTLVLKQLSAQRIDSPENGAYSHRYGDLWLVGGASNAGAGVLRHYFDDAQLIALSAQIDPLQDSPLDYYPLTKPGERFPVNDALLAPRLEPRPASDVEFLHGLLQGLAHIEAAGYAKLAELGAPPLKRIVTNGGGAKNEAWRKMRERLLGVPVSTAVVSVSQARKSLMKPLAIRLSYQETTAKSLVIENCLPLVLCEAAYGSALLCMMDRFSPRNISSNCPIGTGSPNR
ncbi:MAG: FGGY-family carbohydrate kinase, partial [Gallionella sp.]